MLHFKYSLININVLESVKISSLVTRDRVESNTCNMYIIMYTCSFSCHRHRAYLVPRQRRKQS